MAVIDGAGAFFKPMRAAVIPSRSYFQGTPLQFNAPTGSIFEENPEPCGNFSG